MGQVRYVCHVFSERILLVYSVWFVGSQLSANAVNTVVSFPRHPFSTIKPN